MSYKHIFDEAIKVASETEFRNTFETFHDHPELFHFIIAPPSQLGTDTEAIEQATEINSTFTAKLIDKGPSLIGNGSTEIDGVESRHILTLTYLLNQIGTEWGNVVEIGGGYGNYLRLVQDIVSYKSWSIVDLDYILDLQQWVFRNLGIDTSNVHSIKSTEQLSINPDLVIGVHSLSEFAAADFLNYYRTIIVKSKYFFYVTQQEYPSIALLRFKAQEIAKNFKLLDYAFYENGTSVMLMFENMGR